MNFLIIATADCKPDTGGVAEYTHNLALSLKEWGHDVTVAGRKKEGTAGFDRTAPYPIVRIDGHFFRDLISAGRKKSFDYIIVNRCGSDWDRSFVLSKLFRCPLFLIAHGFEITYSKNSKLKTKLALSLSDLIICNSSFTAGEVARRCKTERYILNPCAGIETDVDEELLKQYKRRWDPDGDRAVILSLCRLVKRKGIDMALKALKMVDRKYIYLIAGDGPDRSRLEKSNEELKLQNTVFLGKIDEKIKKVLYKLCSFYLMPNRTLSDNDVEGFGITFLEANLFGKPVIGGRSGGVPDAVEDGKSGFLVEGGGGYPEMIAEKILYLIDNKDRASEMGEYGRKRAEEKFNRYYLAGKFLEYVADGFKKRK